MFYYLFSRACTPAINRTLSPFNSGTRQIGNFGRTLRSIKASEMVFGRSELDSHADTTALGRNSIILSYTGRECEVSPYADSYDSIKKVPIVQGATGYTSPISGKRYILVFNEALYLGDQMVNTLVNPNQLRYFGLTVKDDPYDKDQPMRIESENGEVVLPLHSDGTVIYLDTWSPTDNDLNDFPHVVMSSQHEWNPVDVKFPKTSRQSEEEMSFRSIASVRGDEFHVEDEFDMDDCLLNVGQISQRMLSSVKVHETPTVDQAKIARIAHLHSHTNYDQFATSISGVNSELVTPNTFQSTQRHSTVNAKSLSERWGISVAQAALTLKATSQKYVRSALLPLARRYRVDRMFGQKSFNAHVYSDTMDARVKSINGNQYGQVFATKDYFVDVYPIKTKGDAGDGLNEFITDYGVPSKLTFDGSKEQTKPGTNFMKKIRKYDIDFHVSEPERSNQNAAEGVIREVRKKWFRMMVAKRVPRRLWDYGYRHACKIMQHTASYSGRLKGKTPIEYVTGEKPDIGELLDFGFYDLCWYRENAGLGETQLGRWLGVSHRIGPLMSYWVLQTNGEVISRTTVQRVTYLETQETNNVERIKLFNLCLQEKFKEEIVLTEGSKPDAASWAEIIGDDPDFEEEFQKIISDKDLKEADDVYTPDAYDGFTNMELAFDRGDDGPSYAKVTKRLRDAEGKPIGTAHSNPILDSRMYEVEYLDGYTTSIAANAIAENMFAQVDAEGNRHVLFDEIIDHRCDGTEVKMQDAFLKVKGRKVRKKTTKGWEILVQWKDGSTTWVKLKDMKEAYPVQVAEYSVQNHISLEPAFAWWTPYALKKRNRNLAKVKSKYWVRTHKYGIEVPKTVKKAQELDVINGDTKWWDSILKEMKNNRVAFEEWEGTVDEIPKDYQEINCHMIFDVKMIDEDGLFRRKARYVADGHKTDTPAALSYASVVARDSVKIVLTLAALNDVDILACDIQNAYLTAECREKVWLRAGPEFGSEEGKIMIVKMALYGLKSSGAAFRSLLAEVLMELGYSPSQADPDVWMRQAVKPNGFEYYEYVLCYVDDILSVSHKPMETMDGIRARFTLKDDKVEEPADYLGAQLSKMTDGKGGKPFWSMSSEKYCKAAISNVEDRLGKEGRRLPSKCKTPMMSNYAAEMDVTAEMKSDGIQYYQELIGVLRWACEIGRVDILLETSLLSSYLAAPRIGHLEAVFHIFGYLKHVPRRKLGFDPSHPYVDETRFHKFDWEDFYRGAEEAIPTNMPVPRGNPVSTTCFVDANHAGNKVTRRSQTGILLFLCKAPIMAFSKRQNTVEVSTFGSEFTALKNAVELIDALRYKLRMFGVPIEGPTNVFCDNESVYKNVSTPESVLKKKHHSIAYHRCRESVAAKVIRIAWEPTATNLSDIFTKVLPQFVRDTLLDYFTY